MKFADLKTKTKILIGVCTPLALGLAIGGISSVTISSIVESNKWVDHTRVVLADSADIIGSAVDMETGMRGYLLAGEDGFLDPYRNGEQATYSRIEALRKPSATTRFRWSVSTRSSGCCASGRKK